MANEKISCKNLKMKNKVDITGKANGFSTSSFWHYSTADKLDSILAGNCFWINNLSGMNDKNEEKLHEEDKEKVFALCFCNTNSEKFRCGIYIPEFAVMVCEWD